LFRHVLPQNGMKDRAFTFRVSSKVLPCKDIGGTREKLKHYRQRLEPKSIVG
jgi:hypothetical protein